MARILYGAPESEREEDNGLVAKLREKHTVEYLNDWLGFALELWSGKNIVFGDKIIQKKYDLLFYDTRLYGGNWHLEIRTESFKFQVTNSLKQVEIPAIILADEGIQEKIKEWIDDKGFHYVAQPYAVDDVVKKVNSILRKPRRKKQQ